MVTHSNSARREEHKSHRHDRGDLVYHVGRVVLVGLLFVMFLLLGQSMVQHRFFEGGRYHANGSVGQ